VTIAIILLGIAALTTIVVPMGKDNSHRAPMI